MGFGGPAQVQIQLYLLDVLGQVPEVCVCKTEMTVTAATSSGYVRVQWVNILTPQNSGYWTAIPSCHLQCRVQIW